jgi:hypothetical protein
MTLDRRDALIGVGVAVGAAVLVLFLKKPASGGSASGGSGSMDIAGGFATAGTVYVPTTEYNVSYNKYKGAVSYETTTNNSVATTTTTYGPINSPTGGSSVVGSPVHLPDPGPTPVTIATNGGVVNPPTSQTNTTPAAPAPVAPPPPPPPPPAPPSDPSWFGAMSGMHYATPRGGWDPNSVVDNLKSHGYAADYNSRANIASAMGITGYRGTAAQNVQMLQLLNANGR